MILAEHWPVGPGTVDVIVRTVEPVEHARHIVRVYATSDERVGPDQPSVEVTFHELAPGLPIGKSLALVLDPTGQAWVAALMNDQAAS